MTEREALISIQQERNRDSGFFSPSLDEKRTNYSSGEDFDEEENQGSLR